MVTCETGKTGYDNPATRGRDDSISAMLDEVLRQAWTELQRNNVGIAETGRILARISVIMMDNNTSVRAKLGSVKSPVTPGVTGAVRQCAPAPFACNTGCC